VTNPFTVIQGPCSWSPPLCRLVLWNRVLEPSIVIRIIHICNFRLRVFTFLLVRFDSLAGKAFLARSIKLCLVDNQWSSGVTVAGFESCLIWSWIANVEFSTSRTYRLPLGRSGQYSSFGIRAGPLFKGWEWWEHPPLLSAGGSHLKRESHPSPIGLVF
jgi:hypothetical protein